jgi:hypothetical protein
LDKIVVVDAGTKQTAQQQQMADDGQMAGFGIENYQRRRLALEMMGGFKQQQVARQALINGEIEEKCKVRGKKK